MEPYLEKPQAESQPQITFYTNGNERVIPSKRYEKDDLEPNNIQEFFVSYTGRISEMLINKNRKYGGSAIDPVRIFSKSDTEEQLKVRIDDKLSRIKSSQFDEDEDVIDDLIGYLVLLKAKKAGF